ncbi:small integral membrane protein 15-like [Tigriopus californicus]|uniref:small integral membrane protein 15-like n=1 Tax=Tigriopus californicus TaxID=6832 RepID=UPI0027D9DDAA|nr:small integral membrane protein 15-like [Tigriopus californicus]
MNDPPIIEPAAGKLNMDASTWEGYLNGFLLWAAQEPYTFIFYVLLILSPFFALSAVLSYKLSKAIEKQEGEMKKRQKPSRRAKKDD